MASYSAPRSRLNIVTGTGNTTDDGRINSTSDERGHILQNGPRPMLLQEPFAKLDQILLPTFTD